MKNKYKLLSFSWRLSGTPSAFRYESNAENNINNKVAKNYIYWFMKNIFYTAIKMSITLLLFKNISDKNSCLLICEIVKCVSIIEIPGR